MSRPQPERVLVTPQVLRGWRLPEPTGGKESRGSILVVGGSTETLGAVLLAAEAALRSGAGKLQVAVPASVAGPVAVALPEALVRALPELEGPVALDALGLAAVTADPRCLHHLDGRVVLTPNPTELAIALHAEEDSIEDDPAAAALELAGRARAAVGLGGATSWIAAPDRRLWRDESGGSGL